MAAKIDPRFIERLERRASEIETIFVWDNRVWEYDGTFKDFNWYAQVDDDEGSSVCNSSQDGVLRSLRHIYRNHGIDLTDVPVVKLNPRALRALGRAQGLKREPTETFSEYIRRVQNHLATQPT